VCYVFLERFGRGLQRCQDTYLINRTFVGINKVFSLVLQQERHMNEILGMDTKILINSIDQ